MRFKPEYYADLVYQTKLAETTNIATLPRLKENKIRYVKIIGKTSRNFCNASWPRGTVAVYQAWRTAPSWPNIIRCLPEWWSSVRWPWVTLM